MGHSLQRRLFDSERQRLDYKNDSFVRESRIRTNMMTYRKRKIAELQERIAKYEHELVMLANGDMEVGNGSYTVLVRQNKDKRNPSRVQRFFAENGQ